MSTAIPLYGFGGGGGGTGGTLTVTGPAGVTVTVSKDGKTDMKTADSSGVAVFKGLKSGTWTVTITDGEETAARQVVVNTDYACSITFFTATITVTYPAGGVCTATDGDTTLTAPDTSGTWTFTVTNAGPWTVTMESDGLRLSTSVDAENGKSESVNFPLALYSNGVCYTDYTTFSQNAAVTLNESDITIVSDGGNVAGKGYAVFGPIDATNINKIKMVGAFFASNSSNDKNYAKLYAAASEATDETIAVNTSSGTGVRDVSISLDMANVSGYVYVYAGEYTDAWTYSRNLRLTEVTVE